MLQEYQEHFFTNDSRESDGSQRHHHKPPLEPSSLPLQFGPFPTPAAFFIHCLATLRWLREALCSQTGSFTDAGSCRDPWPNTFTPAEGSPSNQVNPPQLLHCHSLLGIPPELPTTDTPVVPSVMVSFLPPMF